MDNIALESFISYCDTMMIAEEGFEEQGRKYITFPFNSRKYKCKVYIDEHTKEEEIMKKVNAFIKTNPLNNPALWEHLYESNLGFFEDVNDDPYFDGKKILSAVDLKKSISDINLVCVDLKENNFYVCGEWWCEPEHGFSINFPNGKFKPYHGKDYLRDSVCHREKATFLGQHSDAY